MGTEDKAAFQEIKAKNSGKKLIGTHSEMFHCDEVLACTMLQYTNDFANSSIIRSRDESDLD